MCPNGHIGTFDDHLISENGEVSPSVVCPEDDCSFHEWITLADYTLGKQAGMFD